MMNRGDRDASVSENDLPLGSDPRRPWTPVFVLGAIYLAWFGFLLWLATTQVGWK